MSQLSENGQRVVNDLAQRHGCSVDAATHMLFAVVNGNGSMAQFSHSEFGGSGQWMRGGMTMVGDMFNYGLKGRVDGICNDIAGILASEPGLLQTGSFQSQSQNNQNQMTGVGRGPSSLFEPSPQDQWYPQELGQPTSSGAQNNTRYAYFANGRRLAVDTGGDVWVYDTLDHNIGGFSQQQSGSGSMTMSSQYGTVALSSLPVVWKNGQYVDQIPVQVSSPEPAPAKQATNQSASSKQGQPSSGGASSDEIFAAIEKLGDLNSKGFLSNDEFSTKKAELLSRL